MSRLTWKSVIRIGQVQHRISPMALILCLVLGSPVMADPLPPGWHPPLALPVGWSGGGGGFEPSHSIHSFFDIFTELSTDGTGWLAAGPPPVGWSLTTPDYLVNTLVTGPSISIPLSGPVTIHAETTSALPGHAVVGLEILNLQATNNAFPGVVLRSSPTIPSVGQGSFTDLGGGNFHIDSFFDVFTELSLDGGNSWIPSNGPIHLENSFTSVPEPNAATLAVLGAAIAAAQLAFRRPTARRKAG